MREAIGGTWIFQVVIVFILFFTGFMCLNINRSKAFSVKDQILQTIQSYNGIDLKSSYEEDSIGAFADIVSYISNNSYRTTGVMPTDEVPEDGIRQCYTRDGKQTETSPVFCITKIPVTSGATLEFNEELPKMYYYQVVVFYQLDLPVFHELFNFRVVGNTKVLYGGELK